MSDVLKIEQVAKYHKKISNPNEFGPIVWSGMHKEAISCKTKAEAEEFINKRIQKIIDYYVGCETCKRDGTTWHKENKVKFVWKNERSAFDYTCDFHNYVNIKTHKPIMEKKTAYDLYTGVDMETCTAECGADVIPIPDSSNKKKSIPILPRRI